MLPVPQAQSIIRDHVRPLPATKVDVGPPSLGLVLAATVVCDADSPPFDKSVMDGYAVRSADLATGSAELTVIEEVLAGQVPVRTLEPGQATRIMTGAPLPKGTDAVVVIERATSLPNDKVQLTDTPRPGQNILPQGREMKAGETIFVPGIQLRPEHIGLLAGLGRSLVAVHPRPTVAIVPTGDEVVEVWEKPGPGQIRNSNGRMLLAQVARAGGMPRWIGIARDNEPHLRQLITQGLDADVLVLSGGVSAGKVDLVPAVLASMGVEALVQKVRMKPGKPMYFGVKPRAGREPLLVFGLPGNPVSSLVCFELFVRPALRGLMGLPPGPRLVQAILTEDFAHSSNRPVYHPALVEETESGRQVRLVPWFGSPDLRGVTAGNAFALLDEGTTTFHAGQSISVMLVEQVG